MIRASDRVGGAVIGSGLLAALILLPFTQDLSYLVSAGPLVVLIGGLGMALRRMRIGEAWIVLAQAVVLGVFLQAISWPLSEPGENTIDLYVRGVDHIRTHAAPLIADPGLTLILVTAVGLCALFTDVLAEGVDRPAWALLPPMTLYLIGAIGLLEPLPWWCLVALAAGYLWILVADGINSAERWPRHLARNVRLTGRLTPLAMTMGALVGVISLVLTLIVGLLLPLPPIHQWNSARSDRGSGPVELADPMLDMRRNLSLPANQDVLTYTTDSGEGEYLRMASLPRLDAAGWQNAAFPLTEGTRLPQAPGLSTAGPEVNTHIEIGDFSTEYLPLPWAPVTFTASGQWAYGADSLVVISVAENRTSATRNLSYDVTSMDTTPDGQVLSTAAAGRPTDASLTGEVPADMPQEIIDLTLELTQSQPTAALKAAAIQSYLRGGDFTYSLDPGSGTGFDAMKQFLLVDKKGYCEQFAGSMAAMARIAGIPSRVAVGWLPGDRQADGSYQVTLHDMHAWPELYFEDVGWVRFEPTPGVATAPAWSMTDPDESASSESPLPVTEPSEVAPSEAATATPEPTETAAPQDQTRGGLSPLEILGRVGIALGLLAALAAVAALPGLLRRRRRTVRLAVAEGADLVDDQKAVDAAWAEVADSFVDYGYPWPAGSPRTVGRRVSGTLPAAAGRAVTTLAHEVERSRYADRARHHGDLAALVGTIRAGLDADKSWDVRLLAQWWPRSWWLSVGRALSWSAMVTRFRRLVRR